MLERSDMPRELITVCPRAQTERLGAEVCTRQSSAGEGHIGTLSRVGRRILRPGPLLAVCAHTPIGYWGRATIRMPSTQLGARLLHSGLLAGGRVSS